MADIEQSVKDGRRSNKCSALEAVKKGQTCCNVDAKQCHCSSTTSVWKNLHGLSVLLVCSITVVILGVGCFIIVTSSSDNNNNNSTLEVPMMRGLTPSFTTASASASAKSAENHQRSNNDKHGDLFLLSGQSNMVGHTTSGQSITSNGDYWNKIKSILEQGGNLNTMEDALYNVIYEANYYYKYGSSNEQVARTLTNGVMDLYKSELLNDLDTPLQFGKCSFIETNKNDNVYDVSQGTVPTVWNANCGYSFGHELLFARTMELGMKYTTEFEMHKVARGGSGLYEHWYPNHGQHWNLLKGAIEERRGQGDWKGFIWHQGSQEAWSEKQYGEDRSLTYYGNLTGLVNEVRELMFQNSISWQCKEEIPVVIVQVGYWPLRDAAQRTRDAQARFCDEDPRAVLVKTDDLARNYHYDAASFLISGNRIAHAYQEALRGVVQCPDRVPSGSPSDIVPSYFPTPAVASSYVPTQIDVVSTDVPTGTLTDLPVAVAATSRSPSPTMKPTSDRSSTSSTGCEDSNAKIFKLLLNTRASFNTTWTLYNDSDAIFRLSSNLDSDTDYIERICVTPNSYRFEVNNIGEGCYEGYLRGTLIFESCDDGVHNFTLDLHKDGERSIHDIDIDLI